jgi:hypothetical protein
MPAFRSSRLSVGTCGNLSVERGGHSILRGEYPRTRLARNRSYHPLRQRIGHLVRIPRNPSAGRACRNVITSCLRPKRSGLERLRILHMAVEDFVPAVQKDRDKRERRP